MPTDTVLTPIVYRDVAGALEWLTATFGFAEHNRYGAPAGPVQGAQMRLGDAWIMLESAREGSASPALVGQAPQYVTVFVDGVDVHIARTRRRVRRSRKTSTRPPTANGNMVSRTRRGTGGASRSTSGTWIPRLGGDALRRSRIYAGW